MKILNCYRMFLCVFGYENFVYCRENIFIFLYVYLNFKKFYMNILWKIFYFLFLGDFIYLGDLL